MDTGTYWIGLLILFVGSDSSIGMAVSPGQLVEKYYQCQRIEDRLPVSEAVDHKEVKLLEACMEDLEKHAAYYARNEAKHAGTNVINWLNTNENVRYHKKFERFYITVTGPLNPFKPDSLTVNVRMPDTFHPEGETDHLPTERQFDNFIDQTKRKFQGITDEEYIRKLKEERQETQLQEVQKPTFIGKMHTRVNTFVQAVNTNIHKQIHKVGQKLSNTIKKVWSGLGKMFSWRRKKDNNHDEHSTKVSEEDTNNAQSQNSHGN